MSAGALFVSAGAAIWAVAAVWLSVIDLRRRVLPTRIIWRAAAGVWACWAVASILEARAAGLIGAAAGAAACGAALAVIHFAHPPAMGFGDVRLSVLNGLFCGWWGWQSALAGLAAGFALAFPEAVVALVRSGPGASRPLGPYLAAGAALAAALAAFSPVL